MYHIVKVVLAQEIVTMALAVRAVNHGVVYRKATNVIPINPSASQSTVIYEILQRNMRRLVDCQSLAKRKRGATLSNA
jgi:hypothetical protein